MSARRLLAAACYVAAGLLGLLVALATAGCGGGGSGALSTAITHTIPNVTRPATTSPPEGETETTVTFGTTIEVPGHWQLQGHGRPAYTNVRYPFPLDPPHVPDENPTGAYRRTFDLPADWPGDDCEPGRRSRGGRGGGVCESGGTAEQHAVGLDRVRDPGDRGRRRGPRLVVAEACRAQAARRDGVASGAGVAR